MEVAILAPVLGLGFLFVVWAGRAGQTAAKVEHAADRGARAAALASRARMPAVGRAEALAELDANGADCVRATADVAVTADAVTVTVRCEVSNQAVAVLPRRAVVASSTEPIDVYRGDE
jgi:Flp pilus assembly protein TadG